MFDFLKKKKKEPVIKRVKNENDFQCHYCGHVWTVNPSKDIFPVSVSMINSNMHVQGKGVLCPNCKKTCIFG